MAYNFKAEQVSPTYKLYNRIPDVIGKPTLSGFHAGTSGQNLKAVQVRSRSDFLCHLKAYRFWRAQIFLHFAEPRAYLDTHA